MARRSWVIRELRVAAGPWALWLALGCGGAAETDPSRAGIGAGGAGAAGTAGAQGNFDAASSSEECRPVGRYQAGKEGSYRPCCAGLTELVTESFGYVNDEPACWQAPHREYACLEGTCGDGICEEAEAPCGCGVDCPDSPWRSDEATCATYRDVEPPPTEPARVQIVNTSDQPLFVHPYAPVCNGMTPGLLQYYAIGAADDWTLLNTYGSGCGASCGDVIDHGWPHGSATAQPYTGCTDLPCPPLEPVRVEPGASLFEPVRDEYAEQQLPRGCAAGVTAEALTCYSRVLPDPLRVYGISAYVSASADCRPPECEPRVISRPIGNWPDADTRLELWAPELGSSGP